MKPFTSLSFSSLLLITSAAAIGAESEADRYWPQWRGPSADGVARNANPPLSWSESENVAWKVPIPGKGSSSPIIWDDTIFVSTAVPIGEPTKTPEPEPTGGGRRRGPRGIQPTQVQQFTILAIRRSDGGVAWKKILSETLPHEGTHPTGTWASPSPVTDGEHVYAFFGSWGLYCLTMDGEVVWQKDFGDMQIRLGFGEGSSPALFGDRIVVTWDHQGQSFIVALDKNTGREIWRKDRDEITSWASPLIVDFEGKPQVVTNATNKVRSYDLGSGELIWETTGMTTNVIPTPIFSDGLVFVTSGFRGNALLAIRLADARGDIAGSSAIAWSLDKDTPYTPSPVLVDNTLYFLKRNNGVLSSFDARTGQIRYGPVRLEDVPNVYASPVSAANRVYIAGREGTTLVLEHGPEFKVLSVNPLDDGFDASPAIVDDELYLRGKNLYRISTGD